MSGACSPFHSVINIVYDNALRGAEALPIPTDTFPAFLHPKVEICFSRNPLSTEHIDLYLVPAVTLPIHRKFQSPQPCSAAPVIAYGPEKLLPLAFDCGCCDYLRSPWALNELRARALRALPPRQLEFEWGTISLERELQGEVLRLREPAAARPAQLTLSAPEAAILRLLILQSGNPVSRQCLQAGLQRLQRQPEKNSPPAGHTSSRTTIRTASRAVDVHISTLRKKFNLLSGKALQPHPIRSIYGYGYVLIHK
ncbi:MAG: hypothetical protein U5P10_05580 [Spirochaetia bacterium]|nr:hypothetical protein [Spirochaetia bacterium]